MSKEEIKSAFGGTQDYDVIFTVESGEIKDEWIGLQTKQWTQPVIITIYVVDKWSAVGTGNKYITAPLVLAKAVNALRKFVKAKYSAPGGTINVWTGRTVKYEQDITFKPTLFKCIVTTEAWMYYNPFATNTQLTNAGYTEPPYGVDGRGEWEIQEGNYSSWAVKCTYSSDDHSSNDWGDTVCFNEAESKMLIFLNAFSNACIVRVMDMSTEVVTNLLTKALFLSGFYDWGMKSIYGTYAVVPYATTTAGGTLNRVSILKNGVVQETITDTNIGITAGNIAGAFISYTGKYIVISGFITADDKWGFVVLEGSA